MQVINTSVRNVNKIKPFLDKLFNNSAKVNIGLIGDSTILYGGYGWDHGQVQALLDLGYQRYGTGLNGLNEGSGSVGNGLSIGYGHNMSSVGGGNASTTAGLPAEWQGFATNRSSSNNYFGALEPWWIEGGVGVTYNALLNYGFILHGGSEALYSRKFEGLTSDLRFSMWYARSATAFGSGLSGTTEVLVRKNNSSSQHQNFNIENVGVTSELSGLTFSLVFGVTATNGITWSNNSSVFGTRLQTAIRTASNDNTATVAANSTTGTGAVSAYIVFNSSLGNTVPIVQLDVAGLTAAYKSGGYGSGITTAVQGVSAGGNYTTVAGATSVNAYQTFTVTDAMSFIGRKDVFLGASATRDYSLMYTAPLRGGATAHGPFVGLFAGASVSGSSSGFAVTTVMALGGKGATTHAGRFVAQTDNFIASIFHAMAEHAGYTSAPDSPVLLRIVGGVNDYLDNSPSIGPAGVSSNTVAGLVDNWKVLIDRVEDVWDNFGWNKDNLFWLITPSAPQQSNDSSISFARQAANQISDERDRVAAVNLNDLQTNFTTDTTALAGYLTTDYDYAHHSVNGFRVWSYYEWASIQNAYNVYLQDVQNKRFTNSSSPNVSNAIFYNGKLYPPNQFRQIISSFYPDIFRD